MAILVTGGAGYIGSHTVAELLKHKERVVVLDNLKKGHELAVPADSEFYQGDIRDGELLDRIFADRQIEAVIHFAADSLVGESVSDPLAYYENNVMGTFKLLERMKSSDIKKIVFSSTAAVYGNPNQLPIRESDPVEPANPYGETKLAIERMLKWCDQAFGIKWIALRYFNAAGAHPSGQIGEDHTPETHLIPNVLHTALGKREFIEIYGDDYPTGDGTCIRDFIHVMDLANAHWKALNRIRATACSAIYNLGAGSGYSVKQIIDTARDVTQKPIPVKIKPRRPGDPAVLVASCEKALTDLNWSSTYNLRQIIQDAWRWHLSHPDGYQESS